MQPTIIFSLRNQQWLVIFSRLRCVLQPHGGATSNRIRIKRRCHQCCPHDIMVYNLVLKYVVQRCCKGHWVSVPCHQRWIQQVSVCLTPITLWLYRLKLKQVAVTGEKQEATDVMGSVVQPPLPPFQCLHPHDLCGSSEKVLGGILTFLNQQGETVSWPLVSACLLSLTSAWHVIYI